MLPLFKLLIRQAAIYCTYYDTVVQFVVLKPSGRKVRRVLLRRCASSQAEATRHRRARNCCNIRGKHVNCDNFVVPAVLFLFCGVCLYVVLGVDIMIAGACLPCVSYAVDPPALNAERGAIPTLVDCCLEGDVFRVRAVDARC